MKNKILFIAVLSLVIAILSVFHKKQKEQLRKYQEAIEFEEVIVARKERRHRAMLYNSIETQIRPFFSKKETELIGSLAAQDNIDDFRSMLAQNKHLPFLAGLQSSKNGVYNSLLLDWSKVELWTFLRDQRKNQQKQVYARKMIFHQIPSAHIDSVSFRLIPITYIKKLYPSIFSYGNKKMKITSFPIPFDRKMKQVKFTEIDPFTKRQNTYSSEVH